MDRSQPFVDAHLHYWDQDRFHYGWLEEAGDALPHRYLPEDREGAGARPEAVVFVQADCEPEQGIAEAAWAAGLVGPCGAVVAFAPVEDDALPTWIDQLAAVPQVVGVRRLLQDEPSDLLQSRELASGLARLASADLSFDACVRHGQLPDLLALRRAAPEVEIVLDHLGKPPIRDGWGSAVAQQWHVAMRALAEEERTTVKLSGLALEAGPGDLAEQARPFLEAALDAFGGDRCMTGSDFPVSAGPPHAMSYTGWFALVSDLTDSADERAALLSSTASRVYRLGP